jgi:hypothetical protein
MAPRAGGFQATYIVVTPKRFERRIFVSSLLLLDGTWAKKSREGMAGLLPD